MLVLLLAANVAVYVIMVLSTHHSGWDAWELLAWGGNLGKLSLHGEAWRLLTATFLHASFTHILGNMVLLLITGGILERKLGSAMFFGVYVTCGLAGSALSAWANPNVVGVGASGAIAGLLGCILILKLTARAPEVRGAWIGQILVLNGIYSFAPNVDGLAHLGGFVAGLALGAVLAVQLPTPDEI